MSIIDKLQPASFKGVPFLVSSANTTGGRKLASHEYPLSDRFETEDLGKMRGAYSIDAIISGANYYQDRDNLIAALSSEGSGELVHPLFGTITVVAQPYTLSENLTSLGIAKFSITFLEVTEPIYPTAANNNRSVITKQKDDMLSSLSKDISDIFKVAKAETKNFLDAKALLGDVASDFENANSIVTEATNTISTLDNQVTSFKNDLNSLIFNPNDLGNRVENLFKSVESISDAPKNQYEILKTFFNFGDDDTVIKPTTFKRLNRISNRNIINNSMKTAALVTAYNSITSVDLKTTESVENIKDELDTQYDSIINSDSVALSDDTQKKLKDMRVQVNLYLEEANTAAFKISTIETQPTSATILAYNYYGDVDSTQDILDLNNTINPSYLEGSVKILTL